jgi:hypothetical protein
VANRGDILTVEEAGRVIGIGRTTAYAQARAWLATGGAEGIPCRRVGRLIHVYRPVLEEWLGFPITWPLGDEGEEIGGEDSPAETPVVDPPDRSRHAHRPASASQPTLPF